WPNDELIQSCSRPCQNALEESVADAAVPTSLTGLETSPNNDSQPEGATEATSVTDPRSPNEDGSIPSSASKLFTELKIEFRIGSMIASSPSACAGGMLAHGVSPNAKTPPADPPRPSVRRRAFAFADRRFFFEVCRPAMTLLPR